MPEITVTLETGYEKVSPTNQFRLEYPPLYHQQRTYDALKANDLVINTYNTGTGKTRAALLRLFDVKNEFKRSCHQYLQHGDRENSCCVAPAF